MTIVSSGQALTKLTVLTVNMSFTAILTLLLPTGSGKLSLSTGRSLYSSFASMFRPSVGIKFVPVSSKACSKVLKYQKN